MIKIVNIKSGEPYDIYIGRKNIAYKKYEDSIFCNPFVIGKDGSREDVINKFKRYALKNKPLMDSLCLIDDKILGCWCNYPDEDCHGRILIELREFQKTYNKYYTGIGSRETPKEIMELMDKIAVVMATKNYVLRSGGADGADTAFEMGCKSIGGASEIYLPWKNFNHNGSDLYTVSKDALELASTIHPAWSRLSPGAKKLHARNCYQVLGQNLDTPSTVLICWTKDGADIGGTRTAIVLAKKFNIPIYNLGNIERLNMIKQKLKL